MCFSAGSTSSDLPTAEAERIAKGAAIVHASPACSDVAIRFASGAGPWGSRCGTVLRARGGPQYYVARFASKVRLLANLKRGAKPSEAISGLFFGGVSRWNEENYGRISQGPR